MALKNTVSGKAGELSVLAKLTRFGLKVSEPHWNDDEVDYEIRYGKGDDAVNIPLQVKSAQFLSETDKAFVQGLKKQYLKRNSLLCLAIYNPEHDWMWLFCASDTIEAAYENQSKWNKKHRPFSLLGEKEDVRIAIPKDGKMFHDNYRVRNEDKAKVLAEIKRVASRKKTKILLGSHNREPSIETDCTVRFTFDNGGFLSIGGKPLVYLAEGTVDNLLTLAYETIKQYINTQHNYKENNSASILLRVLRELLVNAFAHRSYRSDAPIEVILSEEKFEIASPGGLPDGLSMQEFLSKQFSVTRNPRLVREFVQLRVMENIGLGISTIEYYKGQHIQLQSHFAELDGRFIVTLNVGS